MDDKAIYQIRVAGRLGTEWGERLADMTFVVHEEPTRGTTTVLTGPVPDQAALMGVLEQLYGRGATLLDVERREIDDSGGIHEQPTPGLEHAAGRRHGSPVEDGRTRTRTTTATATSPRTKA